MGSLAGGSDWNSAWVTASPVGRTPQLLGTLAARCCGGQALSRPHTRTHAHTHTRTHAHTQTHGLGPGGKHCGMWWRCAGRCSGIPAPHLECRHCHCNARVAPTMPALHLRSPRCGCNASPVRAIPPAKPALQAALQDQSRIAAARPRHSGQYGACKADTAAASTLQGHPARPALQLQTPPAMPQRCRSAGHRRQDGLQCRH